MKKSTMIAVVLFVVAAAAAIALTRKPAERGISRLKLGNVENTDAIDVSGPNPVSLVKKGDGWALADGREADQAAVKRVIEAGSKLYSSDLLARGADKRAEYEVDDAKGAHVIFKQGGATISDFVIGKNVSGGAAVFANDAIYVVKGASAGTFSRAASTWLERRLVTQTAADATKLEVRLKGEAPYTLVKNDNVWALDATTVLPAGPGLDANIASSLVASVVGLRAKDVLVEPASVPADDADVFVIGWKEGSTTITVARTPGEADNLAAKVEGNPHTFIVSQGTMANVRKPAIDLRDASLMKFAADKAVGLTLIDGKSKTVFAKKDGAWTLVSTTETKADAFRLDPQAVERRVGQVSGAKGTHIIDNVKPSEVGLATSTTKVIVKFEKEPDAVLAFGSSFKDDTRDAVYAQGTTGVIVAAAPYTKSNLLGGLATFAKRVESEADALSQIDPSAMQGLPPEVRASLMKQIEQKKREQKMLEQVQAK